MCGKARPFRKPGIRVSRLCLVFGGVASIHRFRRPGKAEPYRTSGGKAARKRRQAGALQILFRTISAPRPSATSKVLSSSAKLLVKSLLSEFRLATFFSLWSFKFLQGSRSGNREQNMARN